MPVTTGVDKVTGAGARAGLCWPSWPSWRGGDEDNLAAVLLVALPLLSQSAPETPRIQLK